MQNDLANSFGLSLKVESGPCAQYTCSFEEFENICFSIQSHHAYTWLVDIVAADLEQGNFKLEYYFINVENFFWYSIEIIVSSSDVVRSIAHLWRNAMAFEQEIFELFGIQFSRNYSKIYLADESKAPMQKNFGKRDEVILANNTNLNFDVEMKAKSFIEKNNERITFNIKNNLVSKCSVYPGKYHIGLEKFIENKSMVDVYHYLEQYFPQNAIFNTFLISRTAELSLNLSLTNRAKAIRMVLLELNRVSNHIQFLISVGRIFKMEALHSNSLIWFKRVQSLIMSYTGNEFGFGVIRFGGVMKDVSQVWLSRTLNEIVWLENSILQSYKVFIKSQSIKDVFDFELIKKKIANSWSISGPVVRAAGINLDMRKLNPFYFYEDVSFEVPIGVNGSGFDLLLIRFEEIFQSFNIMVQVLDNLPTGQIISEEVNSHFYFKDRTYELHEEDYRKSIYEYLNLSDFSGTSFVEGSDGLINFSMNYSNQKTDRLKYTSSSFSMKTLFEKVVKGNEAKVIQPLWTLFNINMKEVER